MVINLKPPPPPPPIAVRLKAEEFAPFDPFAVLLDPAPPAPTVNYAPGFAAPHETLPSRFLPT